MKDKLLLLGGAVIALLILGEFATYVALVLLGKLPVSALTDLFSEADKYLIAGGTALFTSFIHTQAAPNAAPSAPFDPATPEVTQ